MNKRLVNKLLPVVFYAVLLIVLGVIGYIGLSRRAKLPSEQSASGATTTAPALAVIALTDCAGSEEQICVNSTGQDVEGNLLVNLRVKWLPLPDLYLRVSDEAREVLLDCQPVDISPRAIYCLGPFTAQGSQAAIEVYDRAGNRLLAAGEMSLDGTVFAPGTPEPAPTEVSSFVITETPLASYPNPETSSYPSYPSYPTYP